jgi:hypothetical protein
LSSLWSTPTIVLWLLTWLAAPPSSLGEAALKESIRRQATTKSTATLTNLGREQEPPPAAAVSGLPHRRSRHRLLREQQGREERRPRPPIQRRTSSGGARA